MKAPFNITLIDPDEYITRKGLLPVTSHAIYESSSNMFHNEGLFSETIFGEVGSTARLSKRGYINLKAKVFTPHIYKQIVSLKSYYKDILAGKEYAVFDEEEHDFIRATLDTPNANTGFKFFMDNYPKIEFKDTGSLKRADKLLILEKYKDITFMTKLIVIPAGVRDVREKDGRVTSEDINKYYNKVLSLAESLPDDNLEDPIFDIVRFQIQNTIMTIYSYISDLLDGKGGFAQSKYTARAITWATRNVITAPAISRVDKPDSPNAFKIDETMVPLFQAMKSAQPLVINKLNNMFFRTVFGNQTENISVINPDTLQLEYHKFPMSTVMSYVNSDGIADFINKYRDIHDQQKDVYIEGADGKKFYLYLVYDDNNEVYIFRNKEDFLSLKPEADIAKIRPMTKTEMCYLATYEATVDKHASVTRYPILNFEGIQIYKIHLTTTEPSRIVTVKSGADENVSITCPEYPIVKPVIKLKQSASVHTATLAAYDGDHDGDTLTYIFALSDEGNKSCQEYLNSKLSLINSTGGLVYGLGDGRNLKHTIHCLTWNPL